MKPGWSARPLRHYIIDIKDGGTPSRQHPEYFGGDVAWCVVKDIKPIITETAETLTDLGLSKCSAKLWPKGSVIISLGATIGEIGIAGVPVATKQGLAGIIPDPSKITSEFLAFALREKVDVIRGMARGATIKEVRPNRLAEELVINVPSLEEQKRIVAVLDQAFAALGRARALADANLADAEELFPSILGQAFEPSAPWPIKTVSDLIDEQIIDRPIDGNHGETHPKKADFVVKGVPFIMASDLKDGIVDQDECYFITRKQADALRKGFAKDGDVLLSHKGTIGRAAILKTSLDYVMLTPQVTYYRVINERRLDREFLYYCFQSSTFLKKMREIAGIGATRAYIGITRQHELEIPLPSLEVQRAMVAKFKSVCDGVASAIELYRAQVSDLAQLRQSLLSKALAGELT